MEVAIEELRQKINRELKTMGYHLQVDNMHRVGAMIGHDYVKPVDPWADELPEVTNLIETRILEFMRENGYSPYSEEEEINRELPKNSKAFVYQFFKFKKPRNDDLFALAYAVTTNNDLIVIMISKEISRCHLRPSLQISYISRNT